MRLLTYRLINLKTKRLGVEADDLIWIGLSVIPGILFQSAILGAICVGISYSYCAFIKPARPRGWLASQIEFRTKQKTTIARLEWKDDLMRLCGFGSFATMDPATKNNGTTDKDI